MSPNTRKKCRPVDDMDNFVNQHTRHMDEISLPHVVLPKV